MHNQSTKLSIKLKRTLTLQNVFITMNYMHKNHIIMNKNLLTLMTLLALVFSIAAAAQTAALEIAPGDDNPTENVPARSTLIRLQNNTNNATNGNTVASFTPNTAAPILRKSSCSTNFIQ